MVETKKRELFSILSAGFFLLYVLINTNPLSMMFSRAIATILSILSVLLVVAAVLNNKKQNVISTVLIGIVTVLQAIPLLVFLYYMITEFDAIGFLWILAYGSRFASFVILTLCSFNNSKNSNDTNKLWIVSVVFEAIYIIFCFAVYLFYGNYILGILKFVFAELLLITGIVFFGMAKSILNKTDCENADYSNTPKRTDGYCDMTKHILLLVFIGSIWQYIWVYRITDYLNITSNEEKRNPTSKLLLCMFVPFYYIYWIYQSARRIEILAKEKNIDSDIVTLSTVLSLFIGIVPPIIMQHKLNQVCKKEKEIPQTSNTNITEQNITNNTDKSNEIRNYKKLLDDGIISQEEFEAKKKQLLGL